MSETAGGAGRWSRRQREKKAGGRGKRSTQRERDWEGGVWGGEINEAREGTEMEYGERLLKTPLTEV